MTRVGDIVASLVGSQYYGALAADTIPKRRICNPGQACEVA